MPVRRIVSRWVLGAASALCLAACEKTPTDSPNTDGMMTQPDLGDPFVTLGPGDGHVADAALGVLNGSGAAKRGRTWNVSMGNILDAGWLLQSPLTSHWGKGYAELPIPKTCSGSCVADFGLRSCQSQSDCTDGGTCTQVAATVTGQNQMPRKLCVGHSDSIYDEMYQVMVSAEKFVDVASLLPPDGRFESAMRNAITYLGNTGKAVQIRLIFGCYPFPGGSVDSKAVLMRLTRDLPAASKVKVYVGNYRSSNTPPSWNHSKIVAADGRVALVGGHNLWDGHYLGKDPVHDLSMRLRGPAARDAQLFTNEQWQYTCATRSVLYCTTGSVCSNRWNAGAIDDQCAPAFDPSGLPSEQPGDVRVVSMGRLALIDPANASNQSDDAFLAILGAARSTIRISQQDLGPPTVPLIGIPAGSWPDKLFLKLGEAMVRGVDVYIVLSNPGSVAGGLSANYAGYSNGWPLTTVVTKLRDALVANPPPGLPSGSALTDLLCKRLHVAPLRFSGEDAFPSGIPYPNHAKFVMVDDQGFYIGSQNQYDAGLTEFGFLVDDARAGALVLRDYWQNLWTQSSRLAVSGTEAATCALR